MKVYKKISHITGVPDYYLLYTKWLRHYTNTGKNSSKVLAFHYARVAEEMGQAMIEEDTTQEIDII